MRVPVWFKKFIKDPGSQKLTAACLVGFPLFSVFQTLTNHYVWFSWPSIETGVIGWGLYFFLYLPIAYLLRNNP